MPFPPPAETDDPARARALIARRAEEIWRELGCPRRRDIAIWLEAEAEILAIRDRAFRHPHLPDAEDG